MIMNLNESKKRSTTYHLLDTLGTNDPDITKITDFILHTVYNRPLREKSPTDARVAMLREVKGKKQKYRSTKAVPPDVSSLNMKIR